MSTPKVQLIKDARPEFPCEMYDTATEQWSRRESIDDRFTRLDIHNERLTHWRPLVPDAPMEAPFLRRSRMGRCNSPKCEPLHPSPAASKDGWSDQTGTSFEGEFKPIAMTQSFPLPTTDEAIADRTEEIPGIVKEAEVAGCENDGQTIGYLAAEVSRLRYLIRSTPSPSQDTEAAVYEVVDSTDEEQYWPLGVFLTEADALSVLDSKEPPNNDQEQDAVTIEVRSRKIGFAPHDYTKIASRTWAYDYASEDDTAPVWSAKEIQFAARNSPSSHRREIR